MCNKQVQIKAISLAHGEYHSNKTLTHLSTTTTNVKY